MTHLENLAQEFLSNQKVLDDEYQTVYEYAVPKETVEKILHDFNLFVQNKV